MRLNVLAYVFFIGVLLTGSACKKGPSGEGTTTPTPPVLTTDVGLLTVSPAFPTDNAPVTLTFDASKGNAALNGFAGEVYMHIGVITDQSTSPTNWKYVKVGSFTTADASVKMNAIGGGKYQFTLTPRAFFGVPAGEKILQIAVLFRSADGAVVARNADGSDMFTPIYESTPLQVKFSSPEFEPMFVPKSVLGVLAVGGTVQVKALSSRTANLTLSLNGQSFATAAAATSITGTATITANGIQQIKISAVENGLTTEKTFEFIINGTPTIEALPAAATKDGVNIINNGTSAIFNFTAPAKASVYLIGDFNNWALSNSYALKRTPDGNRWWIQIDNLNPQTEYAYQYFVDGNLRIPDPYTEKILDPANDSYITASVYPNLKAYPAGKTTGLVSTFIPSPTAYNWQINNFSRPAKTDLVIYEMHIRDFVTEHSYAAALAKLTYLKDLGVNAIELMPVNEFEGNSSWGYNTSFYFAADKYYGTKQALQNFIDECHKKGFAVIIDMVLNHSFGQSPMVQLYWDSANNRPAANNPWFNIQDKHPYGVGFDFNHGSADTKYFSKNVMKFWLQEYKVDGFRFDLSKGFTQNFTNDVNAWGQYDASRIAIWKEYNAYIKSVDPNAYVILEHFAADNEEKELAADGMMLWNNVTGPFKEASMGYLANSNFGRILYDQHSGFSSSQQDKLIGYMESHDEERAMYKNLNFGNQTGSYNIKNDLSTSLARQEMSMAFLLCAPGPKMIWQFGELGYDVSIDQNGRTGEKPILWNYLSDASRKALYDALAKIIKLRIAQPVFQTTNFNSSFAAADGIKYLRLYGTGGANVVVVGNFNVTPQTANITFPANGTWYDFMNPSQTLTISGSTYSKSLAPGEYHIYTTINYN